MVLSRTILTLGLLAGSAATGHAACKLDLPSGAWSSFGNFSQTTHVCRDASCGGRDSRVNIHWYKKASFTGAGYASAADSGKAVPSPLPGTKGRQTRRVHEGLPVVVEVYSEAKQNPILGPIFILSSIAADAGTAARNLAEAKRGLRCR